MYDVKMRRTAKNGEEDNKKKTILFFFHSFLSFFLYIFLHLSPILLPHPLPSLWMLKKKKKIVEILDCLCFAYCIHRFLPRFQARFEISTEQHRGQQSPRSEER